MAGYDDTRQMIISTLMGRPNGEEIKPENQQAYELNMLEYIRSLELLSNSPLIGIATPNTQPVQPNSSRACYISGVTKDSTTIFINFMSYDGRPIEITTEDLGALVILVWDGQYWSSTVVPCVVNDITTKFLEDFESLKNKVNSNRYGYNVTTFGLKGGKHSLGTAILDIPAEYRFLGQKITFDSISEGWVTYQNTSMSFNNYENISNWKKISGNNTIVGDIHIVNLPDDEDITVNDVNLLKFADKQFNVPSFSGLGRIYARKNIQDGKNILSVTSFQDANTIYHIQYDYDLQGQTIALPANIVLNFEGGSFSNGSIIFNNTKIITNINGIFNNIQVSGTIQNNNIFISWWESVEYGLLLNNLITSNDYITIDKDIKIDTQINIAKKCTLTSHLKNTINLTVNNDYVAGINIIASNVIIDNIHLLLNDLDVKGIYAYGSVETYINNVNINNVDISHFGSRSGIHLEYVENSKVTKCKVFDSVAYNGSVSLGGIYVSHSKLINIDLCNIYNIHPKGINIYKSENCIITNSFVSDTQSVYAVGIYTQDSYNVVYDNCIVSRAKGGGCKLSSKSHNVKVVNCSFLDISTGYAIAMQGASDSIFDNCYVETSTTILIDAHPDPNGSEAYNNSVRGCIFKCTASQPYLFDVRQGASKTGGGLYMNSLVRIEKNTIINDGYSIIFNASCPQLYINDNIINNPVNIVRSYYMDNFEFNNNVVNYLAASGGIYIILLTGSQTRKDISVKNNTINATSIDSSSQAFYFSGISSVLDVSKNKIFGKFKGAFSLSAENLIFADNDIHGIVGSYPVIITNTTTSRITGNTIKNCDASFNSIDATSVSGVFSNNKSEDSGRLVVVFSSPLKSVIANNNDNINFINYPTKGTTVNRPTLSVSYNGFQYYDITLNKPIWWNGSSWVDSTGTTV